LIKLATFFSSSTTRSLIVTNLVRAVPDEWQSSHSLEYFKT
jgi:hypothetical protein